MDKKKISRIQNIDDLKGFEEFIEHSSDESAIDKSTKNVGGESLTFLQNDNSRLKKIAELVADKVPVLKNHGQGPKIIEHQRNLNSQLKNEIFKYLNADKSPLHKSLTHMWDSFFQKP
ncbi:MAG: hypothetical protein K2P81_13865 [Bacteriovoracaceae bacterium]|nr:hypothetical protein [Bacteriovoracaceae bacterium]